MSHEPYASASEPDRSADSSEEALTGPPEGTAALVPPGDRFLGDEESAEGEGAPSDGSTSGLSSQPTTQELVGELHARLARRPRRFLATGTDYWVFGIAGVVALALVLWGFIGAESLGSFSESALGWVIRNLGWLFIIAATVFVTFVVVVAVSKFGRINLGRDDEEPEFRTLSWISMMFATGMGIGLVFYGVGEPLFFYLAPPPDTVDGQTTAAVGSALGHALFHWTLYPWAMYAVVGLGIAYGTFRLGRSQLFSSLFTPLFGEKAVNGWGGRVINILAILATLFGSACSLGLGAIQIGGGLQSTGFIEQTTSTVLVGVIVVLTILFIASAASGVARGIQWLSNINMVLALLLALLVFIGGPTLFILNSIPNAIGSFIGDLPQMASRTAAGDPTVAEWMGAWTIFYWAWWVSWTPFVGIFIARISRGRTIRQFVVGVMLVPSAVSLMWFSVFGGGAIGLQRRAEAAGDTSAMLGRVVDGEAQLDFDLVLFQMLDALSLPPWAAVGVMGLTVILIAIFFVTGADSASIVMGTLSEKGAIEPSRRTVMFWGLAVGGSAAAMLLAGGDDPNAALSSLQNITIVSAVPFVIVMLLLCVAIWKDLSRDPLVLKARIVSQVLEETVTDAVEAYNGDAFGLVTQRADNGDDPPMPSEAKDTIPDDATPGGVGSGG